jgi:hypothetical protein
MEGALFLVAESILCFAWCYLTVTVALLLAATISKALEVTVLPPLQLPIKLSTVIDQAALHGLLKKVRDLGMPLLSVIFVGAGPQDTSDIKP